MMADRAPSWFVCLNAFHCCEFRMLQTYIDPSSCLCGILDASVHDLFIKCCACVDSLFRAEALFLVLLFPDRQSIILIYNTLINHTQTDVK